MKLPLLQLYHRFPYPLRVATASVRGYYLHWWRYSANTERLVAEILARDTWSPVQWKHWQEERLGYILHRAATRVPYYRNHWSRRRQQGDRASWEVLQNWPVLKKEPLRADPLAFVADDCDTRRMLNEHTSGSTGTPLRLWFTRESVQTRYAVQEARLRRWHGISRFDRWANLGGRMVTPVSQTQPPFWVWNYGLRQLYVSSYHLSPANIAAYVAALQQHKVAYILGYASSMYAVAQLALDQGIPVPQMRVAISNAEPLDADQCRVIAHAFQCDVRNTYGMSEFVAAASECPHGTLHSWPDVGIIEVVHDEFDSCIPAGQTGRFICTGLVNADMPLIRYEVGDRGAVASETEQCRCGRSLPIIQQIEGRLDDVVITRAGRRIGRLSTAFKKLPVREVQVIQETLDTLRVRVVPAPDFSDEGKAMLIANLQDYVGDMEIILEPVSQIPRSANGKFRAVISRVAQAAYRRESVDQPA